MMFAARSARAAYQTVASTTQTDQASPHRLIELLYDELLASLRQASLATAAGNLSAKSANVSRALAILNGLESSLDFQKGGEVAKTLLGAYRFTTKNILAGNGDNDPARFDEATRVMGEIADAWRQIR